MENEFTTSRGFVVKFLSIEMLIDAQRSSFEKRKPKPPTYTAKSALAEETFPHDETTLVVAGDEEQTKANQAAWQDYQEKLAAWNLEYQKAFLHLVLQKGIVAEMPADDGWVLDQRAIGIDVPDEPRARRIHWLETELVTGTADAEALVMGVLRASGVPEEMLQQMEDSFRHSIQRDTPARPPSQDGEMDDDTAIRTSAGGDGNGDTPQPVRRMAGRGQSRRRASA